ncbi:MAG TPA: PQQ-dependent sugar dehydrogenase [Chryseolinea sp.]|jgi:mono/diheme cytochrome c family protein|nr:PQQ-dependent sugar dehydrogenase [Chryseolinea sp.]
MNFPRITLALCMLASVFSILPGCQPKTSSSELLADTASIRKGQAIFSQQCAACHNFRQDGIGPQLGGLTATAAPEWIERFIRDPKLMIESGDERAHQIFEKYKTIMPSFPSLSDEELHYIISFLSTKKAPDPKKTKFDPNALTNPIPEPIAMSDLTIGLEVLTTIPASSTEGQLTRICKLDFRPDTKELFVVDLRGKLYKLQDRKPLVYLDMAQEKPKFIHKPGLATGFGSFAFHPEFQKNGLLYTTHVESPGSGKADFAYNDSIKVTLQWVLSEWTTDTPNAFPFKGTSRELFRINMVGSFHGVQEITFNPLAKPDDEDYGLLYIGIGDGASVEMGFPFLVHSPEKIWGSIIRIDPEGNNSANGKYGIPPGNPFAQSNNPKIAREIYANGFRNPHRLTWTKKGEMLASNIGHHNIEALYMILPGHDYGWPIREGSFVINADENMSNIFPLPADDSSFHVTYPVAQYDHDEGNAISGGFEYWGNSLADLQGKCIFGDIVKGRVFYVEMSDLKLGQQAVIREMKVAINGKVTTLVDLCGAQKVDMRFGRDHRGELYVLTKPDGKVYKVVSVLKNL